ncbi:cupin domain-containing protein [Shouchella patagoniensis]|uniref:cupin domain-containing protein n=1 Tax=Shouchella patagoniensis TaxID=228576 RepID=UPI001FE2BD47|nr:cupin domain-containing protein [Shouchella patagoniensis]
MEDVHKRVTNDQMESNWISRFSNLKDKAIPLMFIDSILPGHQRLNYTIIGDTASENDAYTPAITEPHQFQLGMVKAPPGNGPAYHTHDYIESFFVLNGEWRFYWGYDEDPGKIEGETIVGEWDLISLPPGVFRGFENASEQDAWLFSILETHQVFSGQDPIWSPQIVKQAKEHHFYSDDKGKMIKPENFSTLEKEIATKLKMGQV